jgi:hypothetical protein
LGQSRSGKTGMAYKILNQYAGPREICVYQHPNPIEIEKIKNVWGKQFKNVRGLLQLETMNEFIIWIDEPQLHFKNPDDLIRFISVVSHHDGTIIFTSNEIRWFAARMEDHIDVWIIKNCYFKTIKRGGVAQDIIKDYFWDDPKKFRLAVNEYIFWSMDEDAEQYNGLHTFTTPAFFNDNLSKPYRAKSAIPHRAGINCKTSSMGIEGVI